MTAASPHTAAGPSRRSPSSTRARPLGGASRRVGSTTLACRLRLTLPAEMWQSAISRAHPDATLEVGDRLEIRPGLSMVEAHMRDPEGGDWVAEVRRHPHVTEATSLGLVDGVRVARVVYRSDPFLPLFKRWRLFRQHPVVIRDGEARWTVLGPETAVLRLLRALGRARVGFAIESVRHTPFPRSAPPLTPRQCEVLRFALEEGYFDVPRRISLGRLAPRIGITSSTLSVTLALVERKLLLAHA